MQTSNRQMRGGSGGMHPERRITLDSIPCDHLSPHPLSVKIYGRPKPTPELLASIEKVGLLQPLVVNEYGDGSYELLVGATRAEAWRVLLEEGKVKTKWIPCRFVHLSPLDGERLVIESNRQRVKTPEQKAREFKELKRIESALAKARMLAGKKADPGANLPRGKARDLAAVAVGGFKGRTAEKVEAIVTAADAGDTCARSALDAVNAGSMSVSRAYKDVVQRKSPEKIDAGKAAATELSSLFKNGEVTRSKRVGLFHVLIRDIPAEQVQDLAKILYDEQVTRVSAAEPDPPKRMCPVPGCDRPCQPSPPSRSGIMRAGAARTAATPTRNRP